MTAAPTTPKATAVAMERPAIVPAAAAPAAAEPAAVPALAPAEPAAEPELALVAEPVSPWVNPSGLISTIDKATAISRLLNIIKFLICII